MRLRTNCEPVIHGKRHRRRVDAFTPEEVAI